MKTRDLLFGALCALALSTTFTACSDDDDDDKGPIIEPTDEVRWAYILNEGNMEGNDAALARYNVNGIYPYESDCYLSQNGKRLGDQAQDLHIYEGRIYVVVSGSRYISKLDNTGKELARYRFTAEEGNPRSVAASGGKVYVTSYSGQVVSLDTLSLQRSGSVLVNELGDHLEEIVAREGKLYVAVAYKVIPAETAGGWNTYVYYDKIAVLDAATLTKEKELTVTSNPNKVYIHDNDIYVHSIGDYYSVSESIQRITPSDEVETIAEATNVAFSGDKLLLIKTEMDYTTTPYTTMNTFLVYDTTTKTLKTENFITDDTDLSAKSIYMFQVDPQTNEIYVGTTGYTETGDIYRFSAEGKLITSFEFGSLYPSKMVFLN